MATVLNLKKARQEIKLDDSPDSPVYVLDLTDKSVVNKGKKIYSQFMEHQKEFERIEDGSEEPEDIAFMEGFWRLIISTCLGDKAYQETVDYVKDGADGEGLDDKSILLIITPLVLYLLEQIGEVVSANNNSAVLKYARSKSAASGAI